MRNSILSSAYVYKVNRQLGTALVLLSILNSCFGGAPIPCNSSRECQKNEECDSSDAGMCVQNYYRSCFSSKDCYSSDSECVSLIENGQLLNCSATQILWKDKRCFCAPPAIPNETNSSIQESSCRNTTVAASISNQQEKYCVSCSSVIAWNVLAWKDVCSKSFAFTVTTDERRGSYFHSCSSNSSCSEGLSCKFFDDDGVYRFCSSYINVNATKACHCAPNEFARCSFLSSCDSGFSCVISPGRRTPSCVPSDSLMRVQPQMQDVDTFPKWGLVSIALVEMVFVSIKCFSLLRKEKTWVKFALISFIIESVIGLSLTALQCYIIIDVYMDRDSNDVDPGLVMFGALMFVFSEICVVVSETVIIWKKMKNEDFKNANDQPRFRFSLVRRVVAKWITIGSTFASICYAFKQPGILYCVLIFWSACTFTKNYYDRYWARIIVSSIYLIGCSSAAAIILLVKFQNQPYEDECSRLSFERASFLIFLLPVNIFLTAVSAFRLQGYSETNEITAEQVEFFETAVFGISVPCLALSIVLCVDTSIILFVVAVPQVAVLLIPTLIEYIPRLFSHIKWPWKSETKSDVECIQKVMGHTDSTQVLEK